MPRPPDRKVFKSINEYVELTDRALLVKKLRGELQNDNAVLAVLNTYESMCDVCLQWERPCWCDQGFDG
jgi:hypothetical protein